MSNKYKDTTDVIQPLNTSDPVYKRYLSAT